MQECLKECLENRHQSVSWGEEDIVEVILRIHVAPKAKDWFGLLEAEIEQVLRCSRQKEGKWTSIVYTSLAVALRSSWWIKHEEIVEAKANRRNEERKVDLGRPKLYFHSKHHKTRSNWLIKPRTSALDCRKSQTLASLNFKQKEVVFDRKKRFRKIIVHI